jgi:uncharacterized protein YeaO (DUF488 family)
LAARIVRLGKPREAKEGLRIGTVRRPPRGVKKEDFARRDYYDTWLPALAPTQKWVTFAFAEPWSAARWKAFEKNYRREMSKPEPQRLLELLAKLSRHGDFSVGCYCEDEAHCHRSILRDLLLERGAKISKG